MRLGQDICQSNVRQGVCSKNMFSNFTLFFHSIWWHWWHIQKQIQFQKADLDLHRDLTFNHLHINTSSLRECWNIWHKCERISFLKKLNYFSNGLLTYIAPEKLCFHRLAHQHVKCLSIRDIDKTDARNRGWTLL